MVEQMEGMFESLEVEKYNIPKKKGPIVPFHPVHLFNDVTKDIFMLQLVDNNNCSDHMVCKASKLTFDASIELALKAKHETLEWCSGEDGLKRLGVVFRFKNLKAKSMPQKGKKRKHNSQAKLQK